MDADTGLISLKCDKNRFGERHTITIRPDWDEATFEVTDSPQFLRRTQELETIKEIITKQPGLTTNAICQQSGMMRANVRRLLKEHIGTMWQVEEQGRSRIYYPMGLDIQTHLQTHRPSGDERGGSMGLTHYSETHQTHRSRSIAGSKPNPTESDSESEEELIL